MLLPSLSSSHHIIPDSSVWRHHETCHLRCKTSGSDSTFVTKGKKQTNPFTIFLSIEVFWLLKWDYFFRVTLDHFCGKHRFVAVTKIGSSLKQNHHNKVLFVQIHWTRFTFITWKQIFSNFCHNHNCWVKFTTSYRPILISFQKIT